MDRKKSAQISLFCKKPEVGRSKRRKTSFKKNNKDILPPFCGFFRFFKKTLQKRIRKRQAPLPKLQEMAPSLSSTTTPPSLRLLGRAESVENSDVCGVYVLGALHEARKKFTGKRCFLTTSNRVKTLFPLKTKVLYGPRFCISGSCHPRLSNQLLGIRVPILLRFFPPYFLPCFLLSWLDFWCHLNPWILLLPLPAIACCPGVQSGSGHLCPSTNCKLLA